MSFGTPALKKRASKVSNVKSRRVTCAPIVFNDEDLTPHIIAPAFYKNAKERSIFVSETGIREPSQFRSMFTLSNINQSHMFSSIQMKGSAVSGVDISTAFTRTTMPDSFVVSQSGSEIDVASGVSEEEEVERIVPMPAFVSLEIAETETIIILDLPSSTVDKDSVEGDAAEKDNEIYEYLTVGKGKNRKMVDAHIQTVSLLTKNKFTEAALPRRTQNYAFVSEWDMHDTYSSDVEQVESKMSLTSVENEETLTATDLNLLKLSKNKRYMESVCVMQRILANNVFNEQQKRFRGLSDPSPFRPNISYNYRLNFLWTFANNDTKAKCVSALCINKFNKDVIAVGYGKFFYDEVATGLVLLWNIKNPVQPEREYSFNHPVTALDFSNQFHNLLAIGFYDGGINVIDVSRRDICIVGEDPKDVTQLYEPIWQLAWYTDYDYYKGQEFLVGCCQNGRIVKLHLSTQSQNMGGANMMRITSSEGKLKGIETLRKCNSSNVWVSPHSAALVFTPHPADSHIYYISTSEGVVHKCSKNYYHQHLELFRAHNGPMYAMSFSPFCNKLFLTCGDDWAIRMWADGIDEPLFEMRPRWMGVQGVAWSPSHSTVFASISGTEIFLWDVQRKTYMAQSSTPSPTKSRNTLLKFTDDGRCLLVADIDGNVHVFSLEDMPFPAFFQANLLTQSIKRGLITRPDLLNSIDKLDGLSYPEPTTGVDPDLE